MRVLSICLVLAASGGCSLLKSRYAMDDPVYAEKYAIGAEKSDLLGKAKQALDARHAAGLDGVYLSGGAQYLAEADRSLAGLELGKEFYSQNWLTNRAALAAYGGDGTARIGLDLGTRVQTPTRIAPFAGLGMFLGAWPERISLVDTDGDGSIDELCPTNGCTIDNWLVAVYPEVGTHFWLNGSFRLTAYGRYFVTTEGRDHDDWLIGIQVTAFKR